MNLVKMVMYLHKDTITVRPLKVGAFEDYMKTVYRAS